MAIYTFELFTRTSHGSLLKVLRFLNGNSSKIILRLILKNVFLLFIYFFLWSWNNAFFMNYPFNHSDIISVKHWGQQKHIRILHMNTYIRIRNMYAHIDRLKNTSRYMEFSQKRIVTTYFQSGWVPYWPLSYCSSPSSVRRPTNNSRLK